MANQRVEDPRWTIADNFARWTVHSALRNPGSPIKDRETIYAALEGVGFGVLFDEGRGPIGEGSFTDWHTGAIGILHDFNQRLSVGWAAKMVAIYLKTTCYLAGYGREGLDQVIHPPLDNRLMSNLKRAFRDHPEIAGGLRHFRSIGAMDDDDYLAIIVACRLIADELGCSLFEVEQFFE